MSAPPIWAGDHCATITTKEGKISTNHEDYIFFLSKDEVPYGCFSNAYREENGHSSSSSIINDNDKNNDPHTHTAPKFWCINQELHYQKAILFSDQEIADKIRAEHEDANEIKLLGRQVKGYDDAKWCEVRRYRVCTDALYAKFSQNIELKQVLLGTGTKILLEAAKDKVWGIGCVEFSNPEEGIVGAILKRRKIEEDNNETGISVSGGNVEEKWMWDTEPKDWVGDNLLGRCLMDVRRKLMLASSE